MTQPYKPETKYNKGMPGSTLTQEKYSRLEDKVHEQRRSVKNKLLVGLGIAVLGAAAYFGFFYNKGNEQIQENTPIVNPLPTQPTPAPQNLEAKLNVSYGIIGKKIFEDGGIFYHYRLLISETNGVDVTFDSVYRELTNPPMSKKYGKDWIVEQLGTDTLKGKENLTVDLFFGTTAPEATYTEIWKYIDANGNSDSFIVTLSTNDFK